jgi:hypothetical protein
LTSNSSALERVSPDVCHFLTSLRSARAFSEFSFVVSSRIGAVNLDEYCPKIKGMRIRVALLPDRIPIFNGIIYILPFLSLSSM